MGPKMEGVNKSEKINDNKVENSREKWEDSVLFQKLNDGKLIEEQIVVHLESNGLSVSLDSPDKKGLDPNCISVYIKNISGETLSSLEQRAIISAIEKGGHLDI